LRVVVGHASTVRPDPCTLGVVEQRGSHHEGRCRPRSRPLAISLAPPYFEPPLTPDGPGSWSMSGSSERPSISSCPAARGRRSVSRDGPPVPAGLLKVRQVPPVVRAPARDPRRERRPRRARRRRPPVARPWGRSQPLDLTGLGRSRRSAKPVDRHQLVSKQDRGLGPDEHLADSAAIATLPLGPQPRNLTVNDADCSLERAGLVADPARALTAVGRVGSAVQQARKLIAATGMF
jgi:hypothetical protein